MFKLLVGYKKLKITTKQITYKNKPSYKNNISIY